MITKHCRVCGGIRGFKRNFGWGTFFMLLITFGWWLLALPFYPKRCITCGVNLNES